MYAFCFDVEENVPREKDCFEMTEVSGFCKVYNYKELCEKI